jgi:hypothetical protein
MRQMQGARGKEADAAPRGGTEGSKLDLGYPWTARMESGLTAQAIRCAPERAGLEFIDENGGGAGVRFKERG